ncbi:MAG: hypothetical protein IJ551_09925 [Prevotella sp.]|nr:hypothetical protein [Prevotella sp.]
MKTKKTAIIVAMAAISGTTVQEANAAAQAALADMQQEFGRENVCALEYTWDPFTGMLA